MMVPIEESGGPACDDTYRLLERHRAGDTEALALLMQRYYPRVEGLVRVRMSKQLLARAEVGDVVQEVFVRIMRSARRFERRGDAEWIDFVARLAQRELANLARRERRKKRGGDLPAMVRSLADSAVQSSLAAQSTGVHSAVVRRELALKLQAHVASLAASHREVIELRSYAGFEWSEVARKMGKSVAACQELHRRARRELGELLRKHADFGALDSRFTS